MAGKPRLILLTDLWGTQHAPWCTRYDQLLAQNFEIQWYNSCALAEIDPNGLTQQQLHTHFLHSGIQLAVNKLLLLEKEPVHIIGFSVGGTIAWKAALSGLPAVSLHALSSTRLRYETNKPACPIHLFFGENDAYRPSESWAENCEIRCHTIANGDHRIYENEPVIAAVCSQLIRQTVETD